MEATKKPQVPFTVAGTFLIAYCVLQVLQYVFYKAGMLGSINVAYNGISLISWLLTATLAVFVTIRKAPVVNTICIGVLFAVNVVSTILYFDSLYGESNLLESAASDLLEFFFLDNSGTFALLMLFLMSIGALTEKRFTGAGKIWVFAMLLKILAVVISSVSTFISIIKHGQYYGTFTSFFIMQLNNSIVYCIGFCLLCKWYGRTLAARREYNSPKSAPRQYVRSAPVVDTVPYVPPQPVVERRTNVEADNIDAIKKYKELLDSGVITEEEFAAKKKQILGL